MTQNSITKSNALIEAGYRLTLTEMQIVLYGISLINPVQKNFPLAYRIDIKKFSDLFNRDHGQIYKEIKEAVLKRFWERDFSYKTEDGKIVLNRWLTRVSYEDKMGFIEVKFSEEVQPYLHQLQSRFTTYYIDKIANFKSIYSIRLYETAIMQLNKSCDDRCKFKMSVNNLKSQLELEEKYKKFYNFRERVLEPAKKEINKHSDIRFSYKVMKLGRSPHEIEFVVTKKESNKRLSIGKNKCHLSPSILEKTKKMALEAGTGWDIYAIEQQFYEFINKKGQPERMEAAFIGFVKKKIVSSP